MTVHFWGTRGSIPTPGRKTEKYGGNTTCVEVRCGDEIVVLDAGTGIRALSEAWAGEFGTQPVSASLLLSHLHWDHIQGFPFFSAAYRPGNCLTIYGEDRATGRVEDLLRDQMRSDYFPVPLSAMQAGIEFRPTTPSFTLGPITVKTMRLPHPGGSLGYRLEAYDAVFVFATDCELDQVARNTAQLAANPSVSREYDPELLAFFAGADLIVIDCQYTDTMYLARRGWGHNSVTTVVDLCAQTRPAAVALIHHDPQSTDSQVTKVRFFS